MERPPQAVAKKKRLGDFFFEKDDLFSGGFFVFFNRTGVLFLQ